MVIQRLVPVIEFKIIGIERLLNPRSRLLAKTQITRSARYFLNLSSFNLSLIGQEREIFTSKLFLQENETNTSELALVGFHEEGTSKGAFSPAATSKKAVFREKKSRNCRKNSGCVNRFHC